MIFYIIFIVDVGSSFGSGPLRLSVVAPGLLVGSALELTATALVQIQGITAPELRRSYNRRVVRFPDPYSHRLRVRQRAADAADTAVVARNGNEAFPCQSRLGVKINEANSLFALSSVARNFM